MFVQFAHILAIAYAVVEIEIAALQFAPQRNAECDIGRQVAGAIQVHRPDQLHPLAHRIDAVHDLVGGIGSAEIDIDESERIRVKRVIVQIEVVVELLFERRIPGHDLQGIAHIRHILQLIGGRLVGPAVVTEAQVLAFRPVVLPS